MRLFPDIPLIPFCILISGLSMMGPAAVSVLANEHTVAREFFYTGLLVTVLAAVTGFAAMNRPRPVAPASRLMQIALLFAALPLVLAIPLPVVVHGTSFMDAYFEMVSCLTTTGMTSLKPAVSEGGAIFPLPAGLVYWKAQTAWFGGLLIWLVAAEIMAPLGVGGFEIVSQPRRYLGRRRAVSAAAGGARLLAYFYFGLTAALWLLLFAVGEQPFAALIAAMSTLSTSGITIDGGFSMAGSGIGSEILICAFMLLALSRLPVIACRWGTEPTELRLDREFGLAAIIVLAATFIAVIFRYSELAALRSWEQVAELAQALWGTVFTAVSVLTTTGFKTLFWQQTVIPLPDEFINLALLGTAAIGGGVATTAGGVKLLRVAELLRFGSAEIRHAAIPSSVPAVSGQSSLEGYEKAVLATIFLMLFVFLLAFVGLGLGIAGFDYKESATLAVAALTSAGPIPNAILGPAFSLNEAAPVTKLLLCGAMIFGRLELLALMTLFNPGIWKRQQA